MTRSLPTARQPLELEDIFACVQMCKTCHSLIFVNQSSYCPECCERGGARAARRCVRVPVCLSLCVANVPMKHDWAVAFGRWPADAAPSARSCAAAPVCDAHPFPVALISATNSSEPTRRLRISFASFAARKNTRRPSGSIIFSSSVVSRADDAVPPRESNLSIQFKGAAPQVRPANAEELNSGGGVRQWPFVVVVD